LLILRAKKISLHGIIFHLLTTRTIAMKNINEPILVKPIRLSKIAGFDNLELFLDSDVYYINGYLCSKIITTLIEEISTLKSLRNKITIILKSDGGYNHYNEKTLRELIIDNKNYTQLYIIVNEYVKSAASVFALSADELYFIDKYSGMGCIDPKIYYNNKWISVFDRYGKDLIIDVNQDSIKIKDIKSLHYKEVLQTLNLTRTAIKNGSIFTHDLFRSQFLCFMGLKNGMDYKKNHRDPVLVGKLFSKIKLNTDKTKIIDFGSDFFNFVSEIIFEAQKIESSINEEKNFFLLGKNIIYY